MTRQEANKKILEILANEIEKFPDGRFNQILINLDFTYQETKDTFSGWSELEVLNYGEESVETLKRITK